MIEPKEKANDIIDQASELTDFMTEAAVKDHRSRIAPESHPRFDGVHCVEEECGVELPEERLSLGRIRCVDCQERVEKSHRCDLPRWR